MDVARGLGDLFAVDSHAAALDRLKGLTPGTDAGMRQEYLQTHKTTALAKTPPGSAAPQKNLL
jgi:hypothetical protein